MAQEIELKLELTPEAAETLLASGALAAGPKRLELRTPYFDTPDGHLAKAGFSLRIRDAGGVRTQTVKAAGTATAGLFARPEWERTVEDDRPVLDDATPLPALLGARLHDIVPIFEIRVERLVWDVPWEDALVEVVLDRGHVVAGERSAPICEIELELKEGAPAALFSLARHLDGIVPLHVGVVNKAERGQRLLGPVIRAFKSGELALSPEMSAADAFRAIAGSCLRQYRLNEAAIDRAHPEAVHQARVALRRLRSAFSIFMPMLDDDLFAGLREETRWLANALGEARDLDVLLSGGTGEPELRGRLEQACDEAYGRALAAVSSARARALMLDLSRWLALGGWLSRPEGGALRDEPVRGFASAALDRFRRRVKKGGRGLENLTDEARHELRKDAKKLRYAAEFFASLFADKRGKRRGRRFIETLSALQEKLGALNDIAMSQCVLGEGESAAAPDFDSDKADLLEEAAEAHDAFRDARPFWR